MSTTQTWDSSIIGITTDDIDSMTHEEQEERAIDEANRAADILQAVTSAFGHHLRPTERAQLEEAAKIVISVTRRPIT